jgi:Tol biopolymer transport system component
MRNTYLFGNVSDPRSMIKPAVRFVFCIVIILTAAIGIQIAAEAQSTSTIGVARISTIRAWRPVISADGSVIAYQGMNDSIVYVYRRVGDTTQPAITNSSGQALATDPGLAISADGCQIAVKASDIGLVAGDSNGHVDIFVRDICMDSIYLVSSAGAVPANGDSDNASLSRDGNVVVFTSDATNLVDDDTNGQPDVFVHDRLTSTIERGVGGKRECFWRFNSSRWPIIVRLGYFDFSDWSLYSLLVERHQPG